MRVFLQIVGETVSSTGRDGVILGETARKQCMILQIVVRRCPRRDKTVQYLVR